MTNITISMNENIFCSLGKDSELLKILKRNGIGVNVKNTLTPNNESREEFRKFCKINGFKPVGSKNAFEFEGKIYGYSVVSGDVPECRQFGDNYNGLVCNFKGKKVKWYSKDQLKIGNVTRIGPDGMKYFNVEGEI